MAQATATAPCPSPPGRKTRRSRATRWRIGALLLVHLLFAVHMAHWVATGETMSPLEPSEAMEFSKHSVVNAGLIFFALLALSTLVFGRFFCGWACHLVALQDLCRGLLVKVGVTPKPLRSRALALVPLVAFAYMFLWPVAYRLWVGDSFALREPELTKERFWETFAGWGVALATLGFCGFAVVYLLGSKGFCTYACPYGALFGVADKLAPGRIRVTDACEGCGHCTQTCTSNVQVAQEVRDYGMVVDPGCMKCMDCVTVCPNDALYFGFGRPSLGAKPRREPRRRLAKLSWMEEGLLAISFLGAFFAFRGAYDKVPFLLALGIGGAVSFFVLKGYHLLARERVAFQNFELKRAGRLTGRGRAFLAVLALVVAVWADTALVQYHGNKSEAAFARLIPLRESWFGAERPSPGPEQEQALREVEDHASSALALGLLPDAQRRVELGWALLMRGDQDGFAREMRRAARHHERGSIVQLELGHFLRSRGDDEGALASYRAAVRAEPRLLYGYEMLRQMLFPDRTPELLEAVSEGVRRAPRNAALRDLYGTLLAATGDAEGAESELRRAIAIDPHLLQTRAKLAELVLQSGRRDECVKLLEEGVAAAPGAAAPLRVLAFTHLLLEELDSAEATCGSALEAGGEPAESHLLMARILEAKGDVEGARDHARQAALAASSFENR